MGNIISIKHSFWLDFDNFVIKYAKGYPIIKQIIVDINANSMDLNIISTWLLILQIFSNVNSKDSLVNANHIIIKEGITVKKIIHKPYGKNFIDILFTFAYLHLIEVKF